MKYTVTIPCYYSEKFLKHTVNTLIVVMDSFAKGDYEIILVNDGSKDKTFQVITDLSNENSQVIGIDLLKNVGQHNAIIAGLREATGDIFINLDDDFQADPALIPKLLKALRDTKQDVVYANFVNKQYNLFKKITSSMHNHIINWLLYRENKWFASGFWVARKVVIEQICKYNSEFTDMQANFLSTTQNIINVDVPHRDRWLGNSGYTLKKAIKLWSSTLNYSEKPAVLFIKLGGVLPAILVIVQLILHLLRIENFSFLNIELDIIVGAIFIVGGYLGLLLNRVLKINARVPYITINRIVGKRQK